MKAEVGGKQSSKRMLNHGEQSLLRFFFFSLNTKKVSFFPPSFFLLTIITRDKAWQKTLSLKCKVDMSTDLWYFYEARKNSQLGKIKIQVQDIKVNNIICLLLWQKGNNYNGYLLPFKVLVPKEVTFM